MAKYERRFKGDFDKFKDYIHNSIKNASSSVTYEDGSDIYMGNTKMAFKVYERYSMSGSNRVSLSITILGKDESIFISAITSGGSQAVFFKINTIGEERFLDLCTDAVEDYISKLGRTT